MGQVDVKLTQVELATVMLGLREVSAAIKQLLGLVGRSSFEMIKENLFEIETYKGCRVRSPDNTTDTLIVEGVRGTDLRILFERRINHWDVELRIYVARGSGSWAVFMSGDKLMDQHKTIWDALKDMAFASRTEEVDAIRQFAIDTIEGKPAKPWKK